MAYDLDPSYKQVPERIADLKAKHPEACLRPLIPERPYWVETIDDKTYLVYAAACYRSPDDPMPGVGVAWEPFPGRTPYTRDSELQNAETSAWGRAIVAALASESKSVASAEDVRNREAERAEKQQARALRLEIASLAQTQGWDLTVLGQEFVQTHGVESSSATPEMLDAFLTELRARALPEPAPADAPPPSSSPQAEGGPGPALTPEELEQAAAQVEPTVTADSYRAQLLAATSRKEIVPVLRQLEMAGLGEAEVADANGEPVALRALAAQQMKAVG